MSFTLLDLPVEILSEIVSHMDVLDRFGRFASTSRLCNSLAFSSPLASLNLYKFDGKSNLLQIGFDEVDYACGDDGKFPFEDHETVLDAFSKIWSSSRFLRKMDLAKVIELDLSAVPTTISVINEILLLVSNIANLKIGQMMLARLSSLWSSSANGYRDLNRHDLHPPYLCLDLEALAPQLKGLDISIQPSWTDVSLSICAPQIKRLSLLLFERRPDEREWFRSRRDAFFESNYFKSLLNCRGITSLKTDIIMDFERFPLLEELTLIIHDSDASAIQHQDIPTLKKLMFIFMRNQPHFPNLNGFRGLRVLQLEAPNTEHSITVPKAKIKDLKLEAFIYPQDRTSLK